MLSTRMANPSSIAHWVYRVISYKDGQKDDKKKDLKMVKQTSNQRYRAYMDEEEDTLKHYMECVVELLMTARANNGERSAAGLITQALASSIPSLTILETPLAPE